MTSPNPEETETTSSNEEANMERQLYPLISDENDGLEEPLLGHAGENEDQRRERGVFVRSYSAIESVCSEDSATLHPTREEQVRGKLEYHFMNPWEKYKKRGRKPWKLMLQVLKVLLITTQVIVFANDRFAVAAFFNDNIYTLRHLFQRGYHDGIISRAYTHQDVHQFLEFAHDKYYEIDKLAIGSYDFSRESSNMSTIPPVVLCKTVFGSGSYIDIQRKKKYSFITPPVKTCQELPHPHNNTSHITSNQTFNFDLLVNMSMHFNISTVDLKLLKQRDPPTCYQFQISIVFDNQNHDGIIKITTNIKPVSQNCIKAILDNNHQQASTIKKSLLQTFDVIVITICAISSVLCFKSFILSIRLGWETARFFREEEGITFTWEQHMEFVNFWLVLVVLSDFFAIIGSAFKIFVDRKDYDYYDTSSIYLGLAVLFVWIGLLRFLGYFKKYNILLVTLQASMPNVIRFFVCTCILFLSYMFCGWIILGPYNKKFKSLTVTAETLYSLVNGDDMYNTFFLVRKSQQGIWIFSQFYLYTFISLFIYVVLSLFISIISDAYERLKDMGHLPHSQIQLFVIHGIIRETPAEDDDSQECRPRERSVRRQRIRSSAFAKYNISTESTGIE